MNYKSYKIYGPYERKDGRLVIVCVHRFFGNKKTVSYPRYVYETNKKITIPDGVDVHHKDENPLNNEIDNLELIEKIAHLNFHGSKSKSKYEEFKECKCQFCKKTFLMNRNQQRNFKSNQKKGSNGCFCSRKCSGKYQFC